MTRALLAIAAGVLPSRWWPRFEGRLSVGRFAWASGLATLFLGSAIGFRGFFPYAEAFTQRVRQAVVQSDDPFAFPDMLFGLLAPINFAFGTPVGLVATYLCVTGVVRSLMGYVDDPRGDPLLTLADSLVHRIRARRKTVWAKLARQRLEGREVADRLVTDEWAGVDAAYVLLASRRKPGWEEGVFVLTPDRWYRIGRVWDMPLPEGLRTAYPLTEVPLGEVLRKGVDYELPELSELSESSGQSQPSRHGD